MGGCLFQWKYILFLMWVDGMVWHGIAWCERWKSEIKDAFSIVDVCSSQDDE